MRRIGIFASALLLVACGDGTTSPPPSNRIAIIGVSLPSTLLIGNTAQATVLARNDEGVAITPLPSLVWKTSNSAIATVSDSGLVTAVATGTDTIFATNGSVTGSAVVQVPEVSGGTSPTVVLSLGVGQSATLAPSAAAEGFQIPSGSGGRYAVIVANLDSVPDRNQAYRLRFDSGAVAAGASRLVRAASLNVQQSAPAANFGLVAEQRLRAYERSHLQVVPDRSGIFKASGAQPASSLQVGQAVSFKVPGNTDNPCNEYSVVQANVMAVGTNVVIMADTASPSGGFTSDDYASMAQEFDQKIFPTDTSYYGPPSDIDNNQRVLILFTPEINKLTPPNSKGFLGGFFFAGDLFPASQCGSSNYAEIFYLVVPDPTGRYNNVQKTATVRQQTRGTLAHEFQHMINSGNHIARAAMAHRPTIFEETWLDEGLAHFAESTVGRVEDNYTPLQRLTGTDIRANANDYTAFYFQNTARFGIWAKDPPTAGVNSALADTSLAVRGAVWSMLRHTADWYSGGSPVRLTRQLASGEARGVANMVQSSGVSWETLLTQWLVANVADGEGGVGVNGYVSLDMRSVMTASKAGMAYPLQVTNLSGPSETIAGSVLSATGSYYMITSGPSAATQTVRLFNNDGSTPANFHGARLIVVRLK